MFFGAKGTIHYDLYTAVSIVYTPINPLCLFISDTIDRGKGHWEVGLNA